jgi:UDP-glucose 4-epimerase
VKKTEGETEGLMKNKKVVITGGAGFIGSNLAHGLAKDNTVTILDDLSTGSIENVTGLIPKKNVTLIKGSILDRQLLERALGGNDYVFHLAAISGIPYSLKDPLSTNEVNITGTLNVLIAARNNNIKKVVFASSSSIYGHAPTLPMQEGMSPNSQSPYALTKLVGEYYCHIFHTIYRLPTICLRYFNVYGPRQNLNSEHTSVVPSFISRLSQSKRPIIYGDGNQTRDFTFVLDAVQANIIAAESCATGVFNIGSGRSITINDLAETLIGIFGIDTHRMHEKPRAGDIRHSLADITLFRTIGYEPRYSLEEGLRETIREFTNGS